MNISLVNVNISQIICRFHCVENVQIQSFFWSVFSRIRTKYGEILCISPYSVRMWENTDLNKLRIWTHFAQCLFLFTIGIFKGNVFFKLSLQASHSLKKYRLQKIPENNWIFDHKQCSLLKNNWK